MRDDAPLARAGSPQYRGLPQRHGQVAQHVTILGSKMLIEQILPKVIGGKATLQARLAAEGRDSGLSDEEIRELISIIPLKLLNSGCFLDRYTNLWRYEFGLPYTSISQKQYVWGTHMWLPVKYLFAVIRCAGNRLSALEQRRYFGRLADPQKHRETLVEFLPILRLPGRIAVGCLKAASRAQFWCPGFGPRYPPTPQYLGQLIGFSA